MPCVATVHEDLEQTLVVDVGMRCLVEILARWDSACELLLLYFFA
jgi:hypothetical protein